MTGSPSTAEPDRDDLGPNERGLQEAAPIITVGQLGRLLGASRPQPNGEAASPDPAETADGLDDEP